MIWSNSSNPVKSVPKPVKSGETRELPSADVLLAGGALPGGGRPGGPAQGGQGRGGATWQGITHLIPGT